MTTRPELRLGGHLAPGIIAVALFVIMAVVFVGAPLGDPVGFDEATAIQNETLQSESPTGEYGTVSADGQTYAVAYNTNDGSEEANVSVANDPGVGVDFREVDTTGDGQTDTVYAISRTSITENIGYLMFAIESDQRSAPGETFLVAFEIIDLVLVGALVGAVVLARRDEGGEVVTALGLRSTDEPSGTSAGQVAADGGTEDGGDN
jgi:NADH-quinone oxidoreductase subunit J